MRRERERALVLLPPSQPVYSVAFFLTWPMRRSHVQWRSQGTTARIKILILISEIRTEAVMQALAMHSKKVPAVPMPSKRTSAVYHAGQPRPRAPDPAPSDSSSDDDSSVFEEDQSRSSQHSRHYERRNIDQMRERDKRDSIPTAQTSSGYSGGGYNRDSYQGMPSNQARSALADVMQNTRRCKFF